MIMVSNRLSATFLSAITLAFGNIFLCSCSSMHTTGSGDNVAASAHRIGSEPKEPDSTGNLKIKGSSEKHLNELSSANVPGTNNGRLACAWAVNRVVYDGIGSEVGGGLSTAEMFEALRSGRGREISLDNAPTGSIIISPTSGPVVGHVGILMDGSGPSRHIYSNSSAHALYMDNFTVEKWKSYYSGEKGLSVRVYQLNQ